MSPLLFACSRDTNIQIMDALVKHGAVVTGDGNQSVTLLAIAIRYSVVEPARYLIETAKVDVNQCDKDGDSPVIILSRGVTRRSPHVAELLRMFLKAGASPTLRDSSGLIPLAIAAKSSNKTAFDILLSVTPPESASELDLYVLRKFSAKVEADSNPEFTSWLLRAQGANVRQLQEKPSTQRIEPDPSGRPEEKGRAGPKRISVNSGTYSSYYDLRD